MAWFGVVQFGYSFVLQSPRPILYCDKCAVFKAPPEPVVENAVAVTKTPPPPHEVVPEVLKQSGVPSAPTPPDPSKLMDARRDGATPIHKPNNNSVLNALTFLSSVV